MICYCADQHHSNFFTPCLKKEGDVFAPFKPPLVWRNRFVKNLFHQNLTHCTISHLFKTSQQVNSCSVRVYCNLTGLSYSYIIQTTCTIKRHRITHHHVLGICYKIHIISTVDSSVINNHTPEYNSSISPR